MTHFLSCCPGQPPRIQSRGQTNREVPVNAKTRRVLDYWALGRKNEFVFYNHETGRPFVDLDTGLALACEKAGITGITWHKPRHTFTTRLLEQAANLATVRQLLGHSSVTVTMRYAHPNLGSRGMPCGGSKVLVTI